MNVITCNRPRGDLPVGVYLSVTYRAQLLLTDSSVDTRRTEDRE
jgi:hypothetical protein